MSSARRLRKPEEIAGILQRLEEDDEYSDDAFTDASDDGEEQGILHDDHSSESEQSGDEDVFVPPVSDGEFEVFLGQNCETFWLSDNSVYPEEHTQPVKPPIASRPTDLTKDAKSELDIFYRFFPLQTIDKIVMYTNKCIEEKSSCVEMRNLFKHKEFRDRDYKTTTRPELLALFGILFLLGTRKKTRTNLKAFWNSDGTGMAVFRSAFSHNRFFFLLQALQFDDIASRSERRETDKLAAIREIYGDFVENCKRNYSPSEFITIDEMLCSFNGRCDFIQYMPSKCRTGLKLYALCDATTFYVHNFEICCGTQNMGPFLTSNEPHDVVMRLVEPLKNSSRHLTTDNYYGSYPLALELLQKGITLTTTLKKTKEDIPPQFLPSSERPVKSSLFGFQDECTLVSFVPKRNRAVILLTTRHNSAQLNTSTGKPEIITDYNQSKGAVESVDQKCTVFSTSCNTKRWSLALFFRFLDICGINSHVIYVANNISDYHPVKFRRMNFLDRLAFGLLDDHFKERSKLKGLPKDVQCFLAPYNECEKDVQPAQAGSSANLPRTGPCYRCGSKKNNKTTVRCSVCTEFSCRKHSSSCVTCYSCQNKNSEDAGCIDD